MTQNILGPGTGDDEGLAGVLGLTGDDDQGGIDKSGSAATGDSSHDADVEAGYDSGDADEPAVVDGTVAGGGSSHADDIEAGYDR